MDGDGERLPVPKSAAAVVSEASKAYVYEGPTSWCDNPSYRMKRLTRGSLGAGMAGDWPTMRDRWLMEVGTCTDVGGA